MAKVKPPKISSVTISIINESFKYIDNRISQQLLLPTLELEEAFVLCELFIGVPGKQCLCFRWGDAALVLSLQCCGPQSARIA